MTDPARQLAKIIHDLNSRWQPHPAQRKILNAIFGEGKKTVMLECGRKFGKALALDTPIPTPGGWKLMGEIQDGDTVFDEQGQPTKVLQAHYVMHGLKCYSVKFSDGAEIKACSDHRWLTWTKAARKSAKRCKSIPIAPAVVTTEQIRQDLTKGKEWNHSIKATEPLELPAIDLPLDPYVLGAWLGDGSRDGGRFTGIDVEIIDQIRAAGFKVNQSKTTAQAWFICGLKPVLVNMDLFKNKHVPPAYLRGSIEQRLALLQGLMDTDGTVSKKGRCDFDNTNEGLSRAVFELAASLGAKPLWGTRIPKCSGIPARRTYRVYFSSPLPAFRLSRKLAKQRPTKKSGHRFIVAVDPIEPEPMRCLTVDSPSSLYLAGKAMIPTHNTELDAYFLWRLALTCPGEYYYFTPLQNQGREIVWANKRFKEFGPSEYVERIQDAEMRIVFTNGSFIKVDGSDNFDKYRGPNPRGAVYDEFRDFRPEFHDAFGPNLGTFGAPLLINGTPPARDIEHYDAMVQECKTEPDAAHFNYPSWANPHIDQAWLASQKRKKLARNDEAGWVREFEAKKRKGGKDAYFPMLDAEIEERKHIRHTNHVKPHAELMAEVLRDKKKLIWQVVCDPGSSTVFCVNFRAINPYTKKVYRLDEIYEREMIETSTSRIVPRIRAKKEELCPAYEAYGIEWDQIYDEAGAWFAAEALASFEEVFSPTQKSKHNIDDGISLLQDQLHHGLTVFSDRCIDGVSEYSNFIRDPMTGKPHSGCNRHYLDTERYGNALAGCDLSIDVEPDEPDPNDKPRFKTPQQDLDDSRDADDFTGLDDF